MNQKTIARFIYWIRVQTVDSIVPEAASYTGQTGSPLGKRTTNQTQRSKKYKTNQNLVFFM